MKLTVLVTLFGAFWISLVGVADLSELSKLADQHRSRRFTAVDATIDGAELIEHRDDDGSSWEPQLSYHYQLDGMRYSSRRYRYLSPSSGRRAAQQLIERFPPGLELTAWIDPRDPSQAVLSRGLSDGDFLLPLFLLPFNAVSLALSSGILWLWWVRLVRPEAGRVPVVHRAGRVHYRLGFGTTWFAVLAVLGATGFVGALLGVLGVERLSPLLLVRGIGLLLVVLPSWTLVRRFRATRDGAEDLILDPRQRALRLPAGHGRLVARSYALSELESLELSELTERDSDGDLQQHHLVQLWVGGQPLVLSKSSDREQAERLLASLAARLAKLGFTSSGRRGMQAG